MNYIQLVRERKLPPPDFIVGNGPAPYLRRWYLIPRNRWFNIYLHHFCRSDDDRALHDHPWNWNASLLLRGSYMEYVTGGGVPDVKVRKAGSFVFRKGCAPHRIELFKSYPVTKTEYFNGTSNLVHYPAKDVPVWTLFITGAKVREWGFYCPRGWVPWQRFTARDNPGEVGAGCGEP